jgi:hypothetical protein
VLNGKADLLGYYRYKNSAPGVPNCRPTSWTLKNPAIFTGVMELIFKLDEVYKYALPQEYARQMTYVTRVLQEWKISHTAFTTAYILKNCPTAIHTDDFDIPEGFGCMSTYGAWEGNELWFPRYGWGAEYRSGDVILADVHELHGNFPLLQGDRVALVLFCRKGMAECPGT